MSGDRRYGVLAEFASPEALVAAVVRVRREFRDVEAFTPYSVDGLADALGVTRTGVPAITLAGGIVGGAGAYFLQWYTAVIDYPENIGGRPLNSWPEFIPVTFETTVLFAAFAAAIAMLAANGLPRLRHPVFEVREFDLATRNRFFLCIPARDPRFDAAPVRRFLEALEPMRVMEVPA